MSCRRYGPRRRHVRASELDAAQVPVRDQIRDNQQNTTYRTTKSTTRNGELNALIPLKAVDTT